MSGGQGDDEYWVDSAGDLVIESTANRVGTLSLVPSVISSPQTWRCWSIVAAAGASNGTGNSSRNWLYGNASQNELYGLDGDDFIEGRGGGDRLDGGAGDDVYFVTVDGDLIVEYANEGHDLVRSWVNFTLPANSVEDLWLNDGATVGTGNNLDNQIWGSTANDQLFGMDGNDVLDGRDRVDTMTGGLGNDTYWINDTRDTVIELPGEGSDRVRILRSATRFPTTLSL